MVGQTFQNYNRVYEDFLPGILVYICYIWGLSAFIIQQIVTLSKYGHDALDICHP